MHELNILLDREIMPYHLPFLYGRHKDKFTSENINLNLETPETIYPELSPLVEADYHFALTTPLRLVHDFLQDIPVVGLARILTTQAGFIYNTEELETPADIRADNQVATYNLSEEVASALLERLQAESGANVTPELKPAAEETTELLNRLRENKLQLLGPANILPEGIIMQAKDIPGDFWFFNDFNLPKNGQLILVAPREFTNSSPNLIRNFVGALHDIIEEIEANPESAGDFYRANYTRPEQEKFLTLLLNSSINCLTTSFSQEHEIYTAWGEFLTENSSASGYLNFDQLLDERFIPLDTLEF